VIHNLTIGHLDPDAITDRRAVVLRPFDNQVALRHLGALGQVNGAGRWMLDGLPVEQKDGYLVCRWLVGPRRNRVAEELAIRMNRETDCLLADREHGRLVDMADLKGIAIGSRHEP
jgi:hypothetical protein